jgi:hypothetical protein
MVQLMTFVFHRTKTFLELLAVTIQLQLLTLKTKKYFNTLNFIQEPRKQNKHLTSKASKKKLLMTIKTSFGLMKMFMQLLSVKMEKQSHILVVNGV